MLRFDCQGTTTRTDVGYIQGTGADNINLVIWHMSGWPYGQSALALTTTTYSPSDGVIVDSDLEVNGENYRWRVLAGVDTRFMDIGNTVTHEAGHFLGLDHVSDAATTMYPTAPPGEISKRVLSSDDINGVCSIYSVDGYDGGIGVNTGGAGSAGGTGGKSTGTASDGTGSFSKPGGCGCTTVGLEP